MATKLREPVQLSEDKAKEIAAWLDENLLEPAIAYRDEVAGGKDYAKLRGFYRGDGQWDGETPPQDYAEFTANMIFPTVDTAKGIGLQTPPSPEFIPPGSDPSDTEFAEALTSLIAEFIWHMRKARMKLGEAWTDAGVVGTAVAKPFWNTRLYGGEGDIDFEVVPVEEVAYDPSARGDDYGFVVHFPRRPLLEIKHDESLSELRKVVKPDRALKQSQEEDSPERWIELVTRKEFWIRGFWLKELIEAFPEIERYVGDDGNTYGVVVTAAGGLVLDIKPHPWLSDRLPFPKFLYYCGDGNPKIYGRGEVAALIDSQVALNARVTQVLHHAALIANKQKVVSDYAVLNEDELNSVPGQVIHVTGPADAAVFELDPGHISPSLFNVISLLLRFFEIIPGMYEVNRGDTPGSVRAGVAIQALQRGGEGRTLQKSFNFDDFVTDLALCMADIAAVMYDEERVYRVTGLNERMEEEMLDAAAGAGAGQEMAGGSGEVSFSSTREITIDPKKFWIGDKKDGKRVDLDARSRVSMFIRSQEEFLQKLMEYMERGIVDAEYVIEESNLPRKEKLLRRLRGVQQQAEQQALPPGEGQMGIPPEAMAPVDGEGPSIAEQDQMMQTVDMLMSEIQELEDQGILPEGTTRALTQKIQAEIEGGGDGSVTLAEAQRLVEAAAAEGPQLGMGM